MDQQITILYAEDELAHVALTKRIFQNLNLPCFVQHFENGKDLVDHLKGALSKEGIASLNNTILLLDLKMPVMDGIQTLEIITSDQQLNVLPVIMYTTSSAPKEMERCNELGCDGYFIKSFSANEISKLFNLIRKAIFKKKQ